VADDVGCKGDHWSHGRNGMGGVEKHPKSGRGMEIRSGAAGTADSFAKGCYMAPWYLQPAWYALAVAVASILVSAALTLTMIRFTHRAHSTYQCDAQFMEIEKVFMADPRLYEFYQLGPEMTAYWSGLSENEKRLYILTEMHYFHLAFVYREYKAKRVELWYWKLCEHWLDRLVAFSPMFREVYRREGANFEDEFRDLVETKIDKAKV